MLRAVARAARHRINLFGAVVACVCWYKWRASMRDAHDGKMMRGNISNEKENEEIVYYV